MYPPITLTGILALDETVILLIRLLIIGFVGIFWIVAIPTVPRCLVICYYPYSLLFIGYLFSGIKWVYWSMNLRIQRLSRNVVWHQCLSVNLLHGISHCFHVFALADWMINMYHQNRYFSSTMVIVMLSKLRNEEIE